MKRYFITLLFSLFGIFIVNAQCNTVSSVLENFDKSSSLPTCWEDKSGLSMIYVKNKRVAFYSLMTPKEDMYLMTPKLKAGTYTLSLDLLGNGGKSSLELISVADVSNKNSFESVVKASEVKGGKKIQTFRLKKEAHLGLKIVLKEMHQAVYLDNISIQPRR